MPGSSAPSPEVGVSVKARDLARLKLHRQDTMLVEGVTLLRLPSGNPGLGESQGLFLKEGRAHRPDDFAHKGVLVVEDGLSLVVFSACSHHGAATIINRVEAAFPGRQIRPS
jgi:7,8-dihydropterin-6-yl-methyl-4-(beta-D-ribofuranosyl)aminobenzene 5'-phosphate synthase